MGQDDEVQLARRQCRQPLLVLVVDDGHQPRHLLHQLPQYGPHGPDHAAFAHGEGQLPLPAARHKPLLTGEAVQLPQQAAQAGADPLGKRGQQELVALAVEQLIPQQIPQLVEGLADGGGGGAEPLGAAGDAAGVQQQVQGDQVAAAEAGEGNEIHNGSTSKGTNKKPRLSGACGLSP